MKGIIKKVEASERSQTKHKALKTIPHCKIKQDKMTHYVNDADTAHHILLDSFSQQHHTWATTAVASLNLRICSRDRER